VYLVFIAYSGFHFHKIDIQNDESIVCHHGTSQPVNNDPINSLLICQFNLVYNSTYIFVETAPGSVSLDLLVESYSSNTENILSQKFPSSNKLRAPPAFPVFC
jgi:hypothetical protein